MSSCDNSYTNWSYYYNYVNLQGKFVGLKNLGATCYVNTFLQLWFHNAEVRRTVYQWRDIEQHSETGQFYCDVFFFKLWTLFWFRLGTTKYDRRWHHSLSGRLVLGDELRWNPGKMCFWHSVLQLGFQHILSFWRLWRLWSQSHIWYKVNGVSVCHILSYIIWIRTTSKVLVQSPYHMTQNGKMLLNM